MTTRALLHRDGDCRREHHLRRGHSSGDCQRGGGAGGGDHRLWRGYCRTVLQVQARQVSVMLHLFCVFVQTVAMAQSDSVTISLERRREQRQVILLSWGVQVERLFLLDFPLQQHEWRVELQRHCVLLRLLVLPVVALLLLKIVRRNEGTLGLAAQTKKQLRLTMNWFLR